MALAKCQKCGCMQSGLQNLAAALPAIRTEEASSLIELISSAITKMHPVQYSCLGCDHCYPAAAQNAFSQAYPAVNLEDMSCEFHVQEDNWPPVVGEYFLLDKSGAIAISTLASTDLAEALASRKPAGVAIIEKTETENIGIDKVIKNVITSQSLRYLILAGQDPKGHFTGQTLLALAENGVDGQGRVIGSKGKRPVLRNVSDQDIQAFRTQIQVIDMIGCQDPDAICARVNELPKPAISSCGCSECGCSEAPVSLTLSIPLSLSLTPKVMAEEPNEAVKLDKAGYFVILPLVDRGVINVEQYSYDHTLIRIIEGSTARAIYHLAINNQWVTEMSHAAYLGKELAKAELSLKHGFKYIQDGA